MNQNQDASLAPPRFVDGGSMCIAGIGNRYTSDASAGIAAQWQRIQPYLGRVPGQVGKLAYGVCRNGPDGGFEYLCGVEVGDAGALPPGWTQLQLAPARYAVFVHRGPVSAIRSTFEAIWRTWLPASGCRVADAPILECYGETFNPENGSGGIEIWVPLA